VRVSASAPGKLVLSGEYAVVEGGAALVAAFDRRVRVSLTTSEQGPWQLHSTARGVHQGPLAIDAAGRLCPAPEQPASEPGGLGLCAEVFDCVLSGLGLSASSLPALHIEVDSAELSTRDAPLGLGSSAAVAVALSAALRRLLLRTGALAREPDASDAFLEDLAAHRQAQGGAGSGVDVAACFHGGLLAYAPPAPGKAARVEALRAPAGLELLCLWTGVSASTTDFLARIRAWREQDEAGFQACMQPMKRLADDALEACTESDAAALLDALAQYHERMAELGQRAGAEVVSAPHRALATLTAAQGAVYKTSGAGGGDFGLAFATSSAVLERVAESATRAGFTPMDLAIDPAGVRVEEG